MNGFQHGAGVAVVTAGERPGLLQGQGIGRGKPARRGHGVGFLQQVSGIDGERGGAAVLGCEAKALAWQKHRIARGKTHPMGVLCEIGVAVVVQKEPVVRMGIDV
jgi:hypothetical protein